jgi:hypothetical protein
VALTALTKVVGVSQILLGTDFPYEGTVAEQVNDLKSCGAFTPMELQAVCSSNARRMLPQLKI